MVVFAVALVTTQAGLSMLEQREEKALIQKGGIFLDTLAGVVAPLARGEAAAAAIAPLLEDVVTYKETLRDEAVAFCCTDGGETVLSPQASGTAAAAAVLGRLAGLQPVPQADLAHIDAAARKLIVIRGYGTPSDPFVLAGAFDIQALLGERRANRRLALALDLALALIAALIAFAATRTMLRPVERLTRALDGDLPAEAVAGAGLAPPGTEVGRLQRAVRRRLDEEEHRARLMAETSERERHAVLARLAAGLAHEVRNPLAGLMGAVSTLRRFGEDPAVRRDTLDLMDRGLATLERVAATTLTTYRPPRSARPLHAADMEDLGLLIRPELKRKSLDFAVETDLQDGFSTDVDAVRQLLLNLLLNACAAAPEGGRVALRVVAGGSALDLAVSDDGPGLPDDVLAVITEDHPDALPRGKRLGLWLVARLIDELKGRIAVESREGEGTTVRVTIPAGPSAASGPDAAAPGQATGAPPKDRHDG